MLRDVGLTQLPQTYVGPRMTDGLEKLLRASQHVYNAKLHRP